jgi:hypothetical protein
VVSASKPVISVAQFVIANRCRQATFCRPAANPLWFGDFVALNSARSLFEMKVFFAAAMIAMLAGPACAQSKAPKALEDMMGAKTPDQIEKEQAADRAYKESLKKIPDAKAPADPWGNARSSNAPATTAQPPAGKKLPAKTGSTAN